MSVPGISMDNLEEAFGGSEDVLAQMLTLFLTQASERMEQLGRDLAVWDAASARSVLHSLVNIAGAVRAYAMSDLAKSVGEAIKAEDREAARSTAAKLEAEARLVLAQARVLLEAASADPRSMWLVALPGRP